MECNICYNSMEYNIKSPKCLDNHAICPMCFFLSRSYKCSYCRRKLLNIEIRKNFTIKCITNYMSNHILLYYALIHVQENMNTSWIGALEYIDEKNKFKQIKNILSNKIFTLSSYYSLLNSLCMILLIFELDNVNVHGIYCNVHGCYISDYTYVFLLIKCLSVINIIFSWVYIFYQINDKPSIRNILYKRLIKK